MHVNERDRNCSIAHSMHFIPTTSFRLGELIVVMRSPVYFLVVGLNKNKERRLDFKILKYECLFRF